MKSPDSSDEQAVHAAKKSTSAFGSMGRMMKRYWFVAIPALMINIGMTLDHVIAKNNENAYRVMVNSTALEVMANKAQDEQPLSDTLQAHWVTTNEQGNLLGRISAIEPSDSLTIPIEKLNVTLLQKGQKVRTGETNHEGKFVLEDVETGVYTIVAAGSSGFLAYGIHVLPKLEGFDKKVSLLAAGPMLETALLAQEVLAESGVGSVVVHPSMVNTPDLKTLKSCLDKTNGYCVSIEDHRVVGGFGALAIHALVNDGYPVKAKSMGVGDHFGRSAYSAQALYDNYGLGIGHLVETAKSLVST